MNAKNNLIRITVWNPLGGGSGEHCPTTARKIKAFQQENNPHIAFYLEAPHGGMDPLPNPDISKSWRQSFWCGKEIGNPKGILAVEYDSCGNEIKVTDVKPAEGKTALGLEVTCNGDVFRIIGVWTSPKKGKSSRPPRCDCRKKDGDPTQALYFDVLADILQHYRDIDFLNPGVPCIVAGDTNVNLSADARHQEEICAGTCQANIDGLKELCKKFGLSFPLPLSKTLSGAALNTLHDKGRGWYRCDLMMVSDPSLQVSARLGKPTYEDDCGKIKSDHDPIIFEISVTV